MTINYIITVLYFLSSIFYIYHLWARKYKISDIAFYIGIAGFLFHTIYLIFFLLKDGVVAGGLSRSLFLFSWFVTLVFLLSRIKFKITSLGAFIFPLAFICTVPSLIIPQGIIETDPTLNNSWILTHVLLIFLGEAFFAIAFIAGILYIFEEKRIKTKRLGSFLMKLPSLTTLDGINNFSFLTGFPLITLGLAIGLFSANQIWGPEWKWDNKETLSLVTWLIYAILINCRLSLGWKGKKSAFGAIIGFSIIVFTFIIGYFLPTQHTFK